MKNFDEMKNEIIEILKEQDNDTLLTIHNDYCDNSCYDDHIYNMDELDDILSGEEPTRIANMIFYGDFRPNDNYFMFNGYANLESFDYVDEQVDFDALANYIIDTQNAFDIDEIDELLNEDEE